MITINQVFFLIGLRYVPTTYAAAIQNLCPALTFVMAVALGFEQVHSTKRYGLAKVLGTVTSIGGATVITRLCMLTWKLHFMGWLDGASGSSGEEVYPARLSFSAFICFFGFLQCLVIVCIAETDSEKWKVHSIEQLCVILYSGLVLLGFAIALQIWCIYKGGTPVTAVFQPVQVVVVAIVSIHIFDDRLYLGGVVGSVLIVSGLHLVLVLWG